MLRPTVNVVEVVFVLRLVGGENSRRPLNEALKSRPLRRMIRIIISGALLP